MFRFKSIQSNIAAAFAVLILLTAVFMGVISYQLSAVAVRDTAKDFTGELVKQVNANIQSYVTNMENISLLVLSHRPVREYLSADAENDGSISEFFRTIMISRKDIASISAFGYEGQRFVSDRNDARLNPNVHATDQPWFREARAAEGRTVVSPPHVQPVFDDEYRWVVSLSREIRSADNTRGLGVLLVDLNFSVINDIVSQIELGKRGYVFIVNDEGSIVYHPQQQLIYSSLKTEAIDKVLSVQSGTFISDEAGQRKMYTVQDSEIGWKIVGVSYADELIGNRREMKLSFAALGVFSLFAAILLSVLLSRNLSKPIHQLHEHMKEVEKGNFNIQVPVDRTKEIGRLARTFNLMVFQIRELMGQVVKEQEFKRKSELNALQAQINPHFLYNTLDSIIWMAEEKKSDEVVLMTSALARLFRASLSKGKELVSIRTEIEHITNYLTIQKMRYRDKLDFQLEVDPAILSYVTLKVTLQPLVENAIYHGIKNKYGTGTIRISGEKYGDSILLHVADNGVGMDAGTLERLLAPARGGGYREGKGVGMTNVHERIRLYFGHEYGLTVASEPDIGTTVTVTIPLLLPEEAARKEAADGWQEGER
ncbi:sensor histidine kinase [Paenibacillus alkaliterrae]|uniref:cache domain-containing sensor histidine kinase n=1 Tax=Paenibacillus alkaliterrae TaxID=320909 RepID=UPI001F1AEB57|nr:sensor histidine kinase [Paenibacillus alkaliterrae]MCF2939479.1 sensor histidine kinase [Paenibacillus alkaliterrae]